ncbi:hypothetical protein [Pseudazoarcus pumilus]|uniref:hypothetical protein n=1 Tax=Pseudazoarcus pumilus TaxID=2067960 RepID=UPI000F4DE423|nr:hypothetical protein [Pseudazoarcus pumilus]
MISSSLIGILAEAVRSPQDFESGPARLRIQAAYDQMLGEYYYHKFEEQMQTRMQLRVRLNDEEHPSEIDMAIRQMLRDDTHLFDKNYLSHKASVRSFIENSLRHFVEVIGRERAQFNNAKGVRGPSGSDQGNG